jgi:hypothetical protein
VVRDQLGKDRQVRYDIRPKGTAPPAAGETWEIVQIGTVWSLDRMVAHPAPPIITGSRGTTPVAVLTNLLTALDAVGLIDDQTTA